MIQPACASRLYLPPYSPKFRPIENAFAKRKALLRNSAERTVRASGIVSASPWMPSHSQESPATSQRPDLDRSELKPHQWPHTTNEPYTSPLI
jgi:hypothetical protein